MGLLDRLLGRRRTSVPRADAAIHQPIEPSPLPGFAVIDVETTGLSPRHDRVLEVAVVRLDTRGSVLDEWTTRFNPEGPVGATHIHGIRESDVKDAPVFREVATEVRGRLAGLAVAAHNARFDLAFVRAEFERAGWELPWLPSFCTLEASHHYLPHLDRRRLTDCCHAAGVRLHHAHSALGDARAAAGLLAGYLTGLRGVPVHRDLTRLPDEALAVPWPTAPVREPVTALSAPAARRPRPVRVTPSRPKQPPLVTQLAGLSLQELLDDGAPEGSLNYLEMLIEVLEDGELSESETAALDDVVELYGLTSSDVEACHRAFVTALAHRALDDGHVSKEERSELHALAELLEVPKATVLQLIDDADRARAARLSAGLLPLPDGWTHGEPLRVGDKVVFTGCDDAERARLEQRATELGVRVLGSVSRLTAMLVTDGSFSGTKLAKATELGIRVVHPEVFEVLLAHLQPAAPATKPAVPTPAAVATGATTPTTTAAPLTPGPDTAASPSQIRTWALANGYEVGVRGRLPRAVVDAYHRENPPN
ncbi:DNA polymerase-3 subunit epsilon [Isoptericola variabilis J7]|uniref:Exonuclease RNase T and DNA polymerase III n=2 Tax=Isoptericola TaxID=254250 RepID=F6FPF1_ISOV2|nr:Exonuclease RNase T and DNA polymerase III [Isoptericola variabilis 225]TWH27345.1 DNA polymerase-3 subunit epsilon [Isoptericola variabilis J7]